jgi:hypothetical protein
MQRFENELPVTVLKMIIQEIDKEADKQNIDWTYDDAYSQKIIKLIKNSVQKFGIINIEYESYGFFWKLYQENHNFDGTGDIVVPKMIKFPIIINVNIVEHSLEKYVHNIFTYDKSYIDSFVGNNYNFEVYEGKLFDKDVYDVETGDFEIIHTGKPSLVESRKHKKVLTESENRELQNLLTIKRSIEKRIKDLSS